MMTISLCCVSSEVRNLPYYNGFTDIYKILDAFEIEVPEDHRFHVLDLALCTTLTRWTSMHKDRFDEWYNYRRMMRL